MSNLKKRSGFIAFSLTLSVLFAACGAADDSVSGTVTAAVATQAAEGSVTDAPAIPEPTAENFLTNPNATQSARVLYNYIRDTFHNGILSGQQESTWMNNNPDYEMDYILEKTGKLPAIRGLDYINEDYDGVTQRAIEWRDKGGIVSICWHWGVPPTGVGYESSKSWGSMIENPNWWTELYDKNTELGKGFFASLDRVADELLKLQAADVPVLWRPFHEFDGGWFWWGMGGSDNFNTLWRFMYDYYTNEKGLNNLIWVLGYSHNVQDSVGEITDYTATWNPGREYFDMAGGDDYPTKPSAMANLYERVERKIGRDETVPMALHEIGVLPTAEQLIEAKSSDHIADWVYFLTWHTSYITKDNPADAINALYSSDYVITLDELPDFK